MTGATYDDALLRSVEKRVLWLAINIVHHANYVRPSRDGIKVGGHQTSSASVVTILTFLYFEFLNNHDKVSVKPHASPVLHAIQYLLGALDARYLKTLREFRGLQSYPSRTKDPDSVDFSTGSVGIGSIAPNFAALAYAYLRDHALGDQPPDRRFVSLVGDAELDEGSIWETIAEPALHGLDRVLWIVDLNRQSLDRVIPGIRVRCWREMFAANGWNVIDVKYGGKLHAAFAQPNGELFRTCLDELSNAAYQRLLRLPGQALREWLPRKSRFPRDFARVLGRWSDPELRELFGNLGGHDFGALRAAFAQTEKNSGPNVLFAYTLKGWGLPSVGHSQNHSALLTADEMEKLHAALGIAPETEWEGFPAASEEGRFCAEAGARLRPPTPSPPAAPEILPLAVGCIHMGERSTQQTFGTILTAVARECPGLARRIVTMSPDVARSTNLGGWINKCSVWQRPANCEQLPDEAGESGIRWRESPAGQHVELGISENNLFMALGQFGLAHELFGELLVPVGTLYDPFVRRGLDAFFYGVYSGAKFIVVGTPSGITLAPEGGAHQSLGCQSIGTEMPELDAYEPCFGQELEWILVHALAQVAARRNSTYLRLSTRPVEQAGFPAHGDAEDVATLRANVLRGAYRLIDRSTEPAYEPGRNVVNLFAVGAVVPEAIEASRTLLMEGIFVNVVNVTGPGPLYRDFQLARSKPRAEVNQDSHLENLISPIDRAAPAVTVIDDHPHTLAWIGGALGTQIFPLGVIEFGQSGDRIDLYGEYGLDASNVMATCRRAIADTFASSKPNSPRVSVAMAP